MRKHKTFGIGCVLLILLVGHSNADENFEDADKSNDYQSGSSNQQFDLRHTIPGEPEVDYPIYSSVPKTSFECTGRHEGYYADTESRCQAFRICAHTARSKHGFGFLCPNGTLFNQKHFVCDWYRNVNCDESEQHYNKNDVNRIGSNYDMMETVRQMMEYPMKTISKALTRNGGSGRRPQHSHHTLKKQLHEEDEATSSSSSAVKQSALARKKAVTRAQVESVKNYANTEDDTEAQNIEKQSTSTSADKSSAMHELEADKTTATIAADDDVYVNSLGELSTDPGVKFDRDNAHIIAESPRSYHYGKRLNFAEKVNAGLNDLAELNMADVLAPDYVKTIRKTQDESTQIDLASNINGLLDEIAEELDPNLSGYQVAAPQKTKHSFKFLSRGFSSQSDRGREPAYAYGKPKQNPSTIRFSPNELPIETYKDSSKSLNTFDNSDENIQFTLMTSTPEVPTVDDSYLIAPTLPPLDVDYLSPPLADSNASLNEAFGGNELEYAVPITLPPSDEEAVTVAFPSTESAIVQNYDGSIDTTLVPPTVYPESNTKPKEEDELTAEISSDDIESKEEEISAHRHAANLLVAGVKLTTHDEQVLTNSATILPVETDGNQGELLIQVDDEPLRSVSTESSELALTTVTVSPPSTSTETVTEVNSVQERIRNYRRFATLHRIPGKPLIYSKRTPSANLLSKSTTAKPSTTTTTTRSYLKRVAASRLRLSRLAAGKVAASSTTSNPLESSGSKASKKIAVRNLDKEIGSSTDISNRPNGNSVADNEANANSGAPTWESVRNNLQRFQVSRNRSAAGGYAYTTAAPTTTRATQRNSLSRSRNRFSNFKIQMTRNGGNKVTTTTTTTTPLPQRKIISSSYSVSSASSAPSQTHTYTPSAPNSLNILNTLSLSSATSPPSKTQTHANAVPSQNTNSNAAPHAATSNFLSFDKLTRSIVDDSILQSYRSNHVTIRPSALYQTPVAPTVAVPTANFLDTANTPAASPTVSSPAFGYGKVLAQAPSQLTPPQRPQNFAKQLSLPSVAPTAPSPRIVIARAEGQRIEPNSVSSIISSLVAQQQPKTTPAAPYVALDDFLTKKFHNNVVPANAYQKVTTTAATFLPQQQPHKQQQQQFNYNTQNYPQQHQIYGGLSQQTYYQAAAAPTQKTTYLPPAPPTAATQQQSVFSYQSQSQYPQQQIHQQQQQLAFITAPLTTQQGAYLPPAQQQQQRTQSNYQTNYNFQQPQQRQLISSEANAYPQQQQQQQQQQQSSVHSSFNYQNTNQQQQQQQQQQQEPHQQLPFNTQNIFAAYEQHQKQLPPFPPLPAAAATTQPAAASPDNYLNVQLPALPNGLIPAPTNQFADKRIDTPAQYQRAVGTTTSTPLSVYNGGASSYDVPLSSIGRLPNDITHLLRRLRKF